MSGKPNGNAVHRHLNDILASPGFARSKKLGAFLSFVVTRAMAGEAGSISERSIALEVYGRPTDFDPKVDGIVRAEAIRLRHKLREFYASASEGGPRIEVPKGGYVPLFSGFEDAFEAAPIKVRINRPGEWARVIAPYAVLVIAAVLIAAAGWRYVAGSGAPAKASGLVAEANARRLIGDEFGAMALLDQALALDPNGVDVHLGRATVLEYLGHLKEARAEIDRTEQLAAQQGIYMPEIAVLDHWLAGDGQGAIQRLGEVLRSRPRDLELLMELAGSKLIRPDTSPGDINEAQLAIRAARRLAGASRNPELDRLEALALGLQGKSKEAIAIAMRGERKAAALKATFSLGRLMVLEGGLLLNDGQEEAAALTLTRAHDWCLSSGDEICVAITYRVDGNRRLVAHHQYGEALREYQQGMVIARQAENWSEVRNLQQGMDEAEKGFGSQLMAADFFRKQFEVLSEALR